MGTIGIRQEVARRLETVLRASKSVVRGLWLDSTLKSSKRLRFSRPLPSAIYARLVDEFVDVLCMALEQNDLEAIERFWPEHAESGRLAEHTHDEAVHVCTTVCRSVSEAVEQAIEGADNAASVRIGLQRLLSWIRDGVEQAPPALPEGPATPPSGFDALVSAAQDLREGLAWTALYDRDVRRSRRLDVLRQMLLEVRGQTPAKAVEAVLRRLHDELNCRLCILVRQTDRHALRLEGIWPVEYAQRELGEAIQLDDSALGALPRGPRGATFRHDTFGDGQAELAGAGVRSVFAAFVPRGKEPAGWLLVGTAGGGAFGAESALPADDTEFVETAAIALGTALDNAALSARLDAAATRLHDLVQAVPEPVLLLNQSGLLLDLSNAAAHLLGAARSDLVRTNLCERGLLGRRDELSTLLAEAGRAPAPLSRLLIGRRTDDSTFRAACSVAALDDGTLVLAFRNITNVVRAAELHRETRNRLRCLLEAPLALALIDACGYVEIANAAFARLLFVGKAPDELVGTDVVNDENAPLACIAGELRGAFEGRPFTTTPFPHTPPGETKPGWLSARGTPVVAAGDDTRVLLVLDDVTEQVLARNDAEASRRNDETASLLTDLARDLNTRLGPVVGHAQMLQQRRMGIGEMAHVNAIERCAQSVRRLVESFIASVRPAAPVPRPCDVNAVVGNACSLAGPLRILVIEPDSETRSMMKKLLAGARHRVVVCSTTDAALQALESSTFDAVIADLGACNSPGALGLSGVDLHAHVAKERPELASRIVFTTAGVCDTRTSAFIHNARCRLITKPFDIHALLAAIAEAVAS
ncbi:MAG: response regulator [Verrucomicrobia bacterium]|nr:response regulator [Verrucomicrobiota bacterium]